MAFLLAFVAVAITIVFARRGILHPGDYLVEAALALHLALFVAIISPNLIEHAGLIARGAPETAIERSSFLLANGRSIELAAVVVALGAVAAAAIRGRAFGGWHVADNRG